MATFECILCNAPVCFFQIYSLFNDSGKKTTSASGLYCILLSICLVTSWDIGTINEDTTDNTD